MTENTAESEQNTNKGTITRWWKWQLTEHKYLLKNFIFLIHCVRFLNKVYVIITSYKADGARFKKRTVYRGFNSQPTLALNHETEIV